MGEGRHRRAGAISLPSAQVGDFLIQMRECSAKNLLVARILRLVQVMHHTSPGQQQAFALPDPGSILSTRSFFLLTRRAFFGFGGRYLVFH